MERSPDALAVSLFSEILAVDQLTRSTLARVLPRGMELSHFSVLNHLANTGAVAGCVTPHCPISSLVRMRPWPT
jgi:hypothetical protein